MDRGASVRRERASPMTPRTTRPSGAATLTRDQLRSPTKVRHSTPPAIVVRTRPKIRAVTSAARLIECTVRVPTSSARFSVRVGPAGGGLGEPVLQLGAPRHLLPEHPDHPGVDLVVHHDVGVRGHDDLELSGVDPGLVGHRAGEVQLAEVDPEVADVQLVAGRDLADLGVGEVGGRPVLDDRQRRRHGRGGEHSHPEQQRHGQDAAGPAHPGRRHERQSEHQERGRQVGQQRDGQPEVAAMPSPASVSPTATSASSRSRRAAGLSLRRTTIVGTGSGSE